MTLSRVSSTACYQLSVLDIIILFFGCEILKHNLNIYLYIYDSEAIYWWGCTTALINLFHYFVPHFSNMGADGIQIKHLLNYLF